MAAPRVLFLDQAGQIGGAEMFLADAAEHCRETCRVILFQDGPFRRLLEESGVCVSALKLGKRAMAVTKTGGLMNAVIAAPHLAKLVLKVARQARGFDLLYANTAKALIVGSMAAALVRIPLIYHLHDFLSASHFSAWNRRFVIAFASRAVAVIANSEATRGSFVVEGGRRQLTHLVYNGFDPARFEQSREPAAPNPRQALGIGAATCLLMAGRLTAWKGQHVLLEALHRLPGVHAVIVGDALFNDGDRLYAEELRKTSRQHGLAGRVHFIGFQREMLSWYRMADIVVHASVAPEPFGRVIVEGMLAGKPVLATAGGGVGEIIDNRVTGYLVNPGDSRGIAETVKWILDHPADALATAERGRQYAREHFAKEAVMVAWDRVIRSVAAVCNTRNHRRSANSCRKELL